MCAAVCVCVCVCVCVTGQKLKFPMCPAYQNMTFPHISYTYLAEDRADFYANKINEMCRKSCPILQISYIYEIQIFIQCVCVCVCVCVHT